MLIKDMIRDIKSLESDGIEVVVDQEHFLLLMEVLLLVFAGPSFSIASIFSSDGVIWPSIRV